MMNALGGLIFLEPQWLWLLLLIPMSLFLLLYQQKQSVKSLKCYRDQPVRQTFRWRYTLFHFGAITALVFALARPGWSPEAVGVNETGRDTIFLLDVSRSMLARDTQPDRLTSAKNAIRRLMSRHRGDRFGLVAFAGTPLLLSPLTNDHFFLNNQLDNLDTNSVSQGGTLIHEALMEVLDKMMDEDSGPSTDLVLISDGEDLGGSELEGKSAQALALLDLLGVRLLVIGLGDNEQGARIPARKGHGWTLNGEKEHWSRRDDGTLRALAQGVEQGVYFPVGTDYLDLPAIMGKLQAIWPGEQRNGSKVLKYTEGYPWLLGLAALLQFLLLLRMRQRVLAAGLMVLSFNAYSTGSASELDVSVLEQQAVAFAEAKEYQKAADIYQTLWFQAETEALALSASFNLATTLVMSALQKKSGLSPQARQQRHVLRRALLKKARRLYRNILMMNPGHQGSARNLEWLTLLANAQQSMPSGHSGAHGQEGGDRQSDQDKKQGSEQGKGKGRSKSSGGLPGSAFTDLMLPSAVESAKDIMDESRKVNSIRAGWQKPAPVERDW